MRRPRRKFVGGTALAAVLVLVSSGCGKKPQPGPPPTAETPRGAFEVLKAALRSGDHGAGLNRNKQVRDAWLPVLFNNFNDIFDEIVRAHV